MNTYPMTSTAKENAGLQAYFGQVYRYMAAGLGLSAFMAWLSVRPPFLSWFYSFSETGTVNYSLLGWVAIFSPLILIFMISKALNQLNVVKAQGFFWLFSALMGVSFGNVFLLFSGSDIFQAFLVTSGMFLGMSFYGFSTKRSLSSWGRFLVMGLIGVVLSLILNFFLKSGPFALALNLISVVIFVGLTAYDTQRLKAIYNGSDSAAISQAKALSGALALYLDFINLFQLMLSFMGNDRR